MLLICYGTRPEWIKIKPIIKKIDGVIPFRLLFTGQHVDLLDKVEYDHVRLEIKDGSNRLDSIVSSIMNNEEMFEGIDSVLVQGDTTSVFAIALAAFHRKIHVIHLEAGLRTYDKFNPYPEEFNRRSVSCIADIHLCPTAETVMNLKKEMSSGQIFLVGNTVLDNLVGTETSYTNKIVITLHRRENHATMDKWFEAIDDLAKEYKEYEFILPIHPNPNVIKHRHILKNVKVIEPLEHKDFVELLASCRFLITDSGGLQEESAFLRKKCIVCRKTSERVEGMGIFSVLCDAPKHLRGCFEWMDADHIPEENEECPYGDGHSADKIFKILTIKKGEQNV
tara:strand:- start:1367 stop:2377 length:1011 start_codon:yes stop_codon:yes gene_type:complete